MVPVCPACRTQVSLGTNACPRCGLAIRPTCGRCGEPLQPGAYRCRSCFETIEGHETIEDHPRRVGEIRPWNEGPITPAPTTRPLGGKLVVGALAGLIVSIGLLVVDTEARRWRWPAASDVRLVDQEAPRQNVTFKAPHHWDLDEVTENVYRIADERPGRDRTMLVQTGKTPFSSFPKRLEQLNGGNYLDYRPLETHRTEVDEREAIRHSFIGDDLEHLQLWIEHGKGVLRIEFTFHPAEGDEAIELADRVLETVDIA